jgi:hypothetical protein
MLLLFHITDVGHRNGEGFRNLHFIAELGLTGRNFGKISRIRMQIVPQGRPEVVS